MPENTDPNEEHDYMFCDCADCQEKRDDEWWESDDANEWRKVEDNPDGIVV